MSKNTHLTHVEDRIITGGKAGAEEALNILKMLGEFLSGSPRPGVAVTTKFDGAPAVVCGTDPSDGQFFVGTKSVFNKSTPKICKSESDIQRMYSGALAQKLSTAFQVLRGANIRGVLQGDMMFTDDKQMKNIDGQRLLTFRPNTITYAVNPATPLGAQISAAKLGMVFHTKYTGATLDSMNASFNVGENDFTAGGALWAQRAQFQDIGGAANMTGPQRSAYDKALRRATGSFKKTGNFLNTIQSGQKTLEIDTQLLQFFNAYVKQGKGIPSVKQGYEDFLFFMENQFNAAIGKVKSLDAQLRKAAKFVEIVAMLEDNKEEAQMMIALYMNIQFCKDILVKKMEKVSKLKMFADKNGVYEATTPEGFVAISNNQAVKLIDRLEFSRLNFTLPKNWDSK